MTIYEHKHADFCDCDSLLASLSEYVDGELSAALCSVLETHLASCRRCRIVVDTLRKTVELYHETADDEGLPEDVRSRLLIRLNLDNSST